MLRGGTRYVEDFDHDWVFIHSVLVRMGRGVLLRGERSMRFVPFAVARFRFQFCNGNAYFRDGDWHDLWVDKPARRIA